MLESKRRAIIFFIIAILLAAVSGYLILQKVREINTELGTMVNVFVANNDIQSRELITPDDLRTTEIPTKYHREEYIMNIDEFINTVSVVPLSEGQIITRNMLKQASAVTEENNRLVRVMESENVHFDQRLSSLDRVDIIVSHQVDGKSVTEIFMKDVKVAQVAEKDGNFAGVQLELAFDEITEFIHMQHYAEVLRIVKSNVGQGATTENEESSVEEDTDVEEENTSNKESTKESNEDKEAEGKQEEESEEDSSSQ